MPEPKRRRKRCTGPCGELKPPEYGSTVDGKWVCADCLPEVAEAIAEAEVQPTGVTSESLLSEAEEKGLHLQRASTLGDKLADKFPPGTATGDANAGGEHAAPAPLTPSEEPTPSESANLPVPSLATKDDRIERARAVPEVNAPGWPLAKGRLSASSVVGFFRCPEQFRLGYIKGQWGPSRGNNISGKAVHEVMDVAMRFKMMHGTDLPAPLVDDVAADAFEAVWGNERRVELEPGKGTRGEWKDRSIAVAQAWVEHLAPLLRPVATEQAFVYEVPGCPVPIVGYVDLVDERALVDYKIGRAYSKVQNDWRVQGLLYLRAKALPMSWHSLSWPLKDGSVSYHSPADAGSALVLPNTAANYDIAGALVVSAAEAIMAYAERFGLDDPWPGNLTHQYACGFCDHHPDRNGGCRWWQREVADPFA